MKRTNLLHWSLSTVTAAALALAPVAAQAAPPEDGAPAEDAPAEGEAAEEAPAEGEAAAEGEAPAEGEAAGEGEAPAEGEAAGEGEAPAEGEEAEGEAAEEAASEDDEFGPEDDDGRPAEPRFGDKPATGKGMIITGGVLLGLGGAFIATAIVVTKCDHTSGLNCRFGNQRDFLVPSAITITALGATLLGVGLGKRARYKKWQEWAPAKEAVLAPTFDRNGGGVSLATRF